MSKSTEKVRAILSHNQELDGKERKAGDRVHLDPRHARALKARGAIKVETEARAAAAASDPSSATVEDLRTLADERGVDLAGATRKADIQAALDAAKPDTAAKTAGKDGK